MMAPGTSPSCLSPPKALSLSLASPPPTKESQSIALRPPTVRGRFATIQSSRTSVSISSILGDTLANNDASSPSDEESHPLSPSLLPAPHQPEGPRRKIRKRASRIARPKDALPFARHRAARASARFSRGRGARSSRGSAPGLAVPVLDRSKLTPFGMSLNSGTCYVDDEPGSNRQVEIDVEPSLVTAPLCLRHAESCQRLMCKRGSNAGKYFFKCAKPRFQQCDFFKWEHELVSSAQPRAPADDHFLLDQVLPEWCPAPTVFDDSETGGAADDVIDEVLHEMFGFNTWRPGQCETVSRILTGCSALAVLPTAGGKSLIYQTVAAVKTGLVVVISPLVALIHSQMASLPDFLPSAALTSAQSSAEVTEVASRVRQGKVKVLFIAPERTFAPAFRKLFSPDAVGQAPSVALVVVDEAHCVSQWGHNFRTAYLRLPAVLFGPKASSSANANRLPLFGSSVPILALTATATADTEKDICRHFRIDPLKGVIRRHTSKPNLVLTLSSVSRGFDAKALELVRRLAEDPFASILGIPSREKLSGNMRVSSKTGDDSSENCINLDVVPARKRRRTSLKPDDDMIGWGSNLNVTKHVQAQKQVKPMKASGCVIVYVNKQRDCDSVRNYVSSSSLHLGGSILAYHAGMSAHERSKVQSQFEKGSVALLIATIAFGMGIHCDRVAGVIHFDLPSSIEAYAQEVGRAGRVGQSGCCHLFFTEFDGGRLLSRAHSDGIDASSVRQVVCKLLDSSFKYRSLVSIEDSRHSSVDETKQTYEGGSKSERDVSVTDVWNEDSWVMSIPEDELCRSLDVKFETGETIVAILENELAGLQLMGKSHLTFTIRFFSETPEAMEKSKSRAFSSYDKAVLRMVVKFAKHSRGQYVLNCPKAGVSESQIAPALRRMQSAGLLAFDVTEPALVAKCTTDCITALKKRTRELCENVHDELVAMEQVKVHKAHALLGMLRKADSLPSDGEQNSFLHNAVEQYFLKGCADLSNIEEGNVAVDENRMKQVREAAGVVWDEEGCGMARARTGRQIARVLHGLDSGRLRAKDWWRCKVWGRFLDVGFECVRRVASEVVREKLRQRRDG